MFTQREREREINGGGERDREQGKESESEREREKERERERREISSQFFYFFSSFSCILALTFISLQINEFLIMGLSINDSVHSCLFLFSYRITCLSSSCWTFPLLSFLVELQLHITPMTIIPFSLHVYIIKTSLSHAGSSNVLAFVVLMKSHLQAYPCPLQINYFEIFAFFLELLLYYNLSLESSQVYVVHHILIQHILVFSFLLEKSDMDGVYVIFILVEHHLSFFFYSSTSCKSYILWFILL